MKKATVDSCARPGLAPEAQTNARIIVLGSLPGERSLARQQYYAHPTNQFWRLVGIVTGQDLQSADYAARIALLQHARLGLWDVIASAERRGSLDQAIRNPQANPLTRWIEDFPELRAVAFNGATASRQGRALLADCPFVLIDLPSSSAANTLPFDAKAERWAVLSQFLG